MQGGGEVRRIQILYFHCRNGKMDQPHLISVQHQNGRGVMLRDVKRWLTELRGEYMAKSYAWSYKRRYRGGYVWQDLADGDLITAISDNEYVLKGSLLHTEKKKKNQSFLRTNASPSSARAQKTGGLMLDKRRRRRRLGMSSLPATTTDGRRRML